MFQPVFALKVSTDLTKLDGPGDLSQDSSGTRKSEAKFFKR